jgi:HAMP domain-containing protein
VLLLGAALAYLIVYEEALKKKADFDNELAQIMIDHSKRIENSRKEFDALEKDFDELVQRMAETKDKDRAEIEHLKFTLNEFIEGRIPGLHPIKFGESPAIFEQNIKYTIKFKRHDSTKNALLYEVSLENVQKQPIIPPPIELIIFSDKGFQVGSSTIALLDEFTLEEIPPGGSKITMGSIRLKLAGKPTFFLIVPQ